VLGWGEVVGGWEVLLGGFGFDGAHKLGEWEVLTVGLYAGWGILGFGYELYVLVMG
jgi:hypothetical protein